MWHNDSLDYYEDYGEGDTWKAFSKRDSGFYHHRYSFEKILRETEKSYYIQFPNMNLWIPKKIIRDLREKEFRAHYPTMTKIINTYIKEHQAKRLEGGF